MNTLIRLTRKDKNKIFFIIRKEMMSAKKRHSELPKRQENDPYMNMLFSYLIRDTMTEKSM